MKFQAEVKRTTGRTALGMLELMFHGAVHNVRMTHTSAMIGLALILVRQPDRSKDQ